MQKSNFITYKGFTSYSKEEMIKRSQEFYHLMNKRRTIRDFSDKKVPKEIIENCLLTAGTAPSGANKQPWYFVAVNNISIKKKIKIAAEKEEKEFYKKRAPKEWLDALKPLGTDSNKSFLEKAPYLIAIFLKKYDVLQDGTQSKNYYSNESTGIATGMLITALHNAGLVSLTHTPSPMNFLNKILNRPKNEKPFLLLVTGYPNDNVKIPDIKRKSLKEISSFIDT